MKHVLGREHIPSAIEYRRRHPRPTLSSTVSKVVGGIIERNT
jgi:hypothetical protein